MKKIVAILLVLVIVLGMVGCGDSKNKEKLVGKWSNGTEKTGGSSWSIQIDRFFNDYIFDSHGNCVHVYTVLNYNFGSDYFGNPEQTEEKRMEIKTGKYKIDDKKITISFTNNKIFKSPEDTIQEKKISEEQIIPYYINQYNDALIFNSDASGESNYEYSSWSKTIDESVSYYEEDYWDGIK